MISTIKAGPAIAESSFANPFPERGAVDAAAKSPKPEDKPSRHVDPAPESGLRLVIERGESNAFYVYRLIDRVTGKVVAELPRDQADQLAMTPSYEAGTVVSTTV